MTDKCYNCDNEFTEDEKGIVNLVICCKCSGVDIEKLKQQDKDDGWEM